MFHSIRRLTLCVLLVACGSPGDTPTLSNTTLSQGTVGLAYSVTISARGGIGTLFYDVANGRPPAGLSLAADGLLSGIPAEAGRFSFTVEVKDRRGASDVGEFTVTIRAADAFGLEGLTLIDAYTDREVLQTLVAQGGAPPLRWAITEGALPAGVTLSQAGVLSGRPDEVGENTFTVTVTDAEDRTVSRVLTLAVFAPPELITSALEPATVGAAYEQVITHTGGKAPVTLSLTGTLPDGLLWSGSSITGAPTSPASASLTFVLQDAGARQSRVTLSLQVHEGLALTTTELPAGHSSRPYSRSIVAAGGLRPYRFEVVEGALPTGLALSSGGVISGTPVTKGDFAFLLQVTDARDEIASRTLTLEVFDPLVFVTPSLSTAYAGEAYAGTLSATGGKPPHAFSLSSGTLPVGISLATNGTLTGTTAATGDFPISVSVVDMLDETVASSATLKVRAPVKVEPAVLADAYLTESFTRTLEASGGDGPLTWSLSAGSLPSGLNLSNAGELSGLVAAGATSGAFTVRAADANARFDERPLSLSVYSLPQLTTTSLGDAHPGAAFDRALIVIGGKAPLTFSLTTGALPAGLTLAADTGRITGTPQDTGTSTFAVRVSDVNGRTDERSFTLELVPPGGTAVLEVASWNIEWFGDKGSSSGTGNGPVDDDLQRQKAAQVISGADIPVWALVEMVDAETVNGDRHFSNLLASLPGYTGFLANHPSVASGSSYYGQSEQKPGFLYEASRVEVQGASLILTAYDSDFAGRPPLRVDTVVDVDGEGVELIFIVVHLKAFADAASRTKRENASRALKTYLDTNLPSERVMVLGDWNDDVDESITWDPINLTRMPTPFENFVTDTANYQFLTSVLSASGTTSTVAHGEVIDHHLATDELAAWHVGPSRVLRPDLWPAPVTNYASTTSDHYPVVSRFDLSF